MLITRDYLRQQRLLHRRNETYGAASRKWAPVVAELIGRLAPRSILDYGAGKRALREALGDEVLAGRKLREYDPAIEQIAKPPGGEFDLVVCIDVLEHIEPGCLDEVLNHITSKTGRAAFLTVHTGPAGKTLKDGRNAHLIQEPLLWWTEQMSRRMDIVETGVVKTTAWLLCNRRGR
jgi:hypothetical protein